MDIDYFLFYFENIAVRKMAKCEGVEEEENKARYLINYLRGRAFEFYFQTFIKNGALTDAGKSYTDAKKVLRQKFDKTKNAQSIVEHALHLLLTDEKVVR